MVVLHHEEIPGLLDQLVSPDDPKEGPHVKIGRDDYDNVFILTREHGEGGEKGNARKRYSLVRLSFNPPAASSPASTQPAGGCEATGSTGAAGAGAPEKAEKGKQEQKRDSNGS